MTETDWLTSTDPQAMLTFLRDSSTLSERKARLFAVACCRCAWHLVGEWECRRAVDVAEGYAEGAVPLNELTAAHNDALNAVLCLRDTAYAEEAAYAAAQASAVILKLSSIPLATANAAAYSAAYDANRILGPPADTEAFTAARKEGHSLQANLLRCICSSPFRPPPSSDPTVLAWQEATVVRLATAAYEERELPSGHLNGHLLAVLADAVEEAGADTELVAHLRGPGPHVRGCHVLDLILGRS